MYKLINRLFHSRHLIVVNTVSCGVLMGGGDIAMQKIDRLTHNRHDPHDWTRTRNMFVMGIALGPVNHAWYTLLDKVLPAKTITTVVKKILADQIFASPVFASSFFLGIGALEGQPIKQSWGEFKGKFWAVYKADWCFWPPAQAINFSFIPSHFRVVYVAMATLVWDTFLSYMKYKVVHEEKEHRKAYVPTATAVIKPPVQSSASGTAQQS